MSEKYEKNQTDKSVLLANHQTDFDIPQKNVWNGHDKTPHADFPGSTEPRWVDLAAFGEVLPGRQAPSAASAVPE